MTTNILVVDDEKEIADLVKLYLANEGYNVTVFYSGSEALESIAIDQYDLAILDIMLPDVSGLEICQKICERHHYPLIMLTAKVEDMDKTAGLALHLMHKNSLLGNCLRTIKPTVKYCSLTS